MPTAFKSLTETLGEKPGLTKPVIRRGPNYGEAREVRRTRMQELVKGQLSQSDMESFNKAPMSIGVPNPHGDGTDAFEPNTIIFDSYATAFGEKAAKKEKDAAGTAARAGSSGSGGQWNTGGNGGPTINADGKVRTMIDAAMGMVGKYYIWGGTTSRGVDCSGLIYYAFNAAGIRMPRYRAVDYRNMGRGVSVADALPGDIVYIDNPNSDTDHVGIYIGNGQMIQSPTTGKRTSVSAITNWNVTSIRRILTDDQLGRMATPSGGSVPSYSGAKITSGVNYTIPTTSTSGVGGATRSRWL